MYGSVRLSITWFADEPKVFLVLGKRGIRPFVQRHRVVSCLSVEVLPPEVLHFTQLRRNGLAIHQFHLATVSQGSFDNDTLPLNSVIVHCVAYRCDRLNVVIFFLFGWERSKLENHICPSDWIQSRLTIKVLAYCLSRKRNYGRIVNISCLFFFFFFDQPSCHAWDKTI